ncbi:TetR family transcriptional regulator [Haloactinopolyspora alba]|uniref:TetR family transcriptional regulator n=1 Tax=Haloactinopolyspora alba TaxID=648780 RepID=A0A2P8DYT1_9ACTN|nr:TetR/AcrR family transcriptional regulator [Haloactinopolyspora alba]PSL02378.1 TetR family transcriptional regulator [Haloactinopolyspora alba]
MPRTADHDARRAQIAAAVVRLVAGDGLDAATVARVAAEAGVSVGLVQHYFPAKDDMLLFAYERVMTDAGSRVAQRIAEGEARQGTINGVVLDSLMELLPVDEARRAEYRVARAFHGRALDNAALTEVARRWAEDIRRRLSVAVQNGTECGEVDPETDAELAAVRMVALVGGLAEQVYRDADRPVGARTMAAAAERILRDCLDDVFAGECRHYM